MKWLESFFFMATSCAILLNATSVHEVQAAGHARVTDPLAARTPGKRVVELIAVEPVTIELPDEARAVWGQDLDAALVRQLEASGKFVVLTPQNARRVVGKGQAQSTGALYHWIASSLPAASASFRVTQMAFLTGDRGARAFYGFNDRIPNLPNDFPLRDTLLEANWMDRTFDPVGIAPWDSQSGLDLGDGFSISAVIAGVRARYARYEARLAVEITVQHLSGQKELRHVEVNTDGFFVDIAGGYLGYSAGIRIARRDAMVRAMEQAATGVAQSLERSLGQLPLTAQVDAILPTGEWLLGTGQGAGVPANTRYRSIAEPGCTLIVVQTAQEGVIARAQSACELTRVGAQLTEAPQVQGIAATGQKLSASEITSEQIYLPGAQMPAAPGLSQVIQGFDPMDIAKFFALPYRIYRYFQYDRARGAAPDPGERRLPQFHWAGGRQYLGQGVKVAVIDSGMDYNHPALFSRVAGIHPNRDVGFDPISGDDRAFDDGYHGTEVASALLSVAPGVRVLPIKAFNPWGVTRTAALVAAVEYAMDSGAEILLLPWATRRESGALKDALLRAQDIGMVIVTASGDRGEDLRKVAAYPAAWRTELESLLVVGGLNQSGRALTTISGKKSNFSTEFVDIAAPGEKIKAARPRSQWAEVTHTGVAAAQAAGVLARELQWGRVHGDPSARHARERVLESAAREDGLTSQIREGRTLRVRSELLE